MMEIAYLAILSVPVLVVFAIGRFGVELGMALVMICAIMYLPVQPSFNPPFLPTLNRETIPLIIVTVVAYFVDSRRMRSRDDDVPSLRGWFPRSMLLRGLFLTLLLYPLGVWLTNRHTLVGLNQIAPGMTFRDFGAMTYTTGFILLSVLVGRRFLHRPSGTRAVVLSLALAGTVYAALNAIEWRLTPFLNGYVYGFDIYRWHILERWGARRPTLFQPIALTNISLMVTSMLAMLVMVRASTPDKKAMWRMIAVSGVMGWIFAWGFGGWLIGIVCGALISFMPLRVIKTSVLVFAVAGFVYPFTRIAGVFPSTLVVEMVDLFASNRARSLNFRFVNEDQFIARILEQPWFGLGNGGRPFVSNVLERGFDVPDSFFILVAMRSGIIGLLAQYGIAFAPLLMMLYYRRRLPTDPMLLGLAVLLMATMLDGYLNSTIGLARWFMIGALIGRVEYELARSSAPTPGREASALARPERGRAPLLDGTIGMPGLPADPRPLARAKRQLGT